ncbi:probable 28S ribosomal protein S23, mitochondrial [Folsomia candida]|uniref:probable 28S ribosomal protein S23, mitochondrial n=1 Tax=Folsomia candida TaxID=158441 RepID=UPI000B902136|nr:probable 28S ribosomal protein S23, mitochondrial [Folsomia candida]
MAGSRLDKIGTIFSRTAGLIKSKAVKYQDRPVWYDVYRVFPPKYEPHIDREPSITVEQIPNILYKEDRIRARFYKTFGLNPDGKPRKLGDPAFEDTSTAFLSKYEEVQAKNPDWTSDQVFNSVAEEYRSTRPKYQQRERSKGENYQSDVDHLHASDVQEDGSVSSEILGRSSGGRLTKTLVTRESLRALFEEAKSNQETNSQQKSEEVKKGDEK